MEQQPVSAVERRLAELGLELPGVVAPVAAYQPAVVSGNYVYTSGQLPMVNGQLPALGKVGAGVTAEQGKEYREEIWRHPERQPTAEDLEDPAGYASRRTAADASTDSLDDDLRKLLEGGFGDAPKEG